MDVQVLKKRIAVSVISQVANQILIGVFGVIILKIMTNDLGSKSYGVYVTIVAFVSTFALLTDLGLNSITTREVAKHPDDANEIISHNMGLRLFLCLVMIPVISCIGFILYPHASNELRFGILLMSCYLFFDSIWASSGSYYSAKVRSDVSAIISSLQQLLFLLCVIGVVIVGWGLFGFLASYVLSVAIGAIIFIWRVRNHIAVRPRMDLLKWRNILRMSIALGVISIINIIYLKADSIMISVIIGTTAVGIYGIAYSLVNIFIYLSSYIMGALTPSMALSEGTEFGQIVQKAFHFMIVFGCLLAVGGFVIRHDIVFVVSSKEFAKASSPFAILALATSFSYINSVFYYASIAINKHNKLLYIALTTLLLNICINLVFIPKFGINGAAWATAITEFIAMILGYRIFCSQTGLRLNLRVIFKPIVAALIALLLGIILYGYLHTSNELLNCLLVSFGVGGPYIAVLYIIDGMPSEMNTVVKKCISLVAGRGF